MLNESDKITVSGIDYYPIPGYPPLAISRCGLLLNTETMKNRKFSATFTGNDRYITWTTRISSLKANITIQRAMALCFIPIPNELQHIPVERLVTTHHARPSTFNQAADIKNIRWACSRNVRTHRSVIITDLSNKTKSDYRNMKQASLSLCGQTKTDPNPSLISTYTSLLGNKFEYKGYSIHVSPNHPEMKVVNENQI